MAYYRTWQTNLNRFASQSQTMQQRLAIDLQIHDPERNNKIPPTLTVLPQLLKPTAGHLPISPVPSVVPHRVHNLQAYQLPEASGSNIQLDTTRQLEIDDSDLHDEDRPAKRPRTRAPKRCWKCGVTGCKGGITKAHCKGACSDCGGKDCEGRSSRNPTHKCPVIKMRQERAASRFEFM